jgi:hypothetical protein
VVTSLNLGGHNFGSRWSQLRPSNVTALTPGGHSLAPGVVTASTPGDHSFGSLWSQLDFRWPQLAWRREERGKKKEGVRLNLAPGTYMN